MDRLKSSDFMATSTKRVTRYQIKQFRSVFPFLDLPAELRIIVYDFAANPETLDNFFNDYYDRLIAKRANNKPWAYHNRFTGRLLAPPKKKAPNVFLINKQIFAEASHQFLNRGLNFHHGMLETAQMSEFITPHLLRNITSINITDFGHDEIIVLQSGVTKSLPCSWNGYIRLLTQLGTTLSANGHKLKNLTIDFSKDKRLVEHMGYCWEGAHVCGFRDQFRIAMDTFHGVRGVGRVTLLGFNSEHAEQLKTRMQSKPKEFSDLPKRVREIIFGHALGFNNISDAITKAIADWPDKSKKSFPYPYLVTPTVLQMNRKYRDEALEVLKEQKKMLTIVLPAMHNISMHADMPKLSRFIGRATLKTVQAVKIKIGSRDWLVSLDKDFIDALASPTKLISFDLTFTDDLQSYEQYPFYPDQGLHQHFKRLLMLRGLKHVKLSGLPLCYLDAMADIMTSTGRNVPKLKVIYCGNAVDIDDVEDIVDGAAHHAAK